MDRRKFIRGAAVAGAATAATAALSAPAISQGRIEWKMVTSWPKGLPGLGTGAERLGKHITDLTGGRLSIKVFSAGELVPALQCFDAVANGTAEMGHDAAYYHLQKSQAFGFFTAFPMGLTKAEQDGWIYHAGGQQLWDEISAPFGIKAFMAGNTGVQMGGWFRKEIASIDDLKGLKFRMPGHGGQVLQRLGSTVVMLPGGEIFANLQSGAIDGTEWVGPYNDLALGFYKVAKNYYWPGFHEPGASLQLMVHKSKFEALPSDLRLAVEVACRAENDFMMAEFNGRSPPALQSLINEHGVQLRQFPREVLQAYGRASGELLTELMDKGDASFKKVANAWLRFRGQAMAYTRITDQGYANARLLDYPFPRGQS